MKYLGKISNDKDLVTKEYVDEAIADVDVTSQVSGKEDSVNKTTSISSSSTDAQYPSAKAVYTAISEIGSKTTSVSSSSTDDEYPTAKAVYTAIENAEPDLTGMATETYVNNAVSGVIDDAPAALNTLKELAAAIGNDASYYQTVNNALAAKTNDEDLAAVAKTGSYTSLSNKPSIPNKTSDLTNDSGFLTTHQDISGKADKDSDAISGNVAKFDANGNPVDSGFTLGKSVPSSAVFTDTVYNDTALSGRVTTVEDLLNSHSVGVDVPSNAVFTDTTYSAATTSAAGLMSASDKSKLNGIASGAQVNQNAFSNITVGSTTVAADSTTDTVTFVAGDNVTITPDATNDKITIAATDTTYSAATTSAAGLMSASDKSKLDGIASGANNYTYTLPVAGSTIGGVKSGTDITVDSSGNVSVNDDSHNHVISNIDGLQDALDGKSSTSHTHSAYVNQNAFSNVAVGSTTVAADSATDTLTLAAGSNITLTPDATNDKITIAATDTTYSAATTSAAGLMSASDKSKLDGIASSANNYSLPTASASTLGGVKVGTNLSISDGVLSAKDTTYTLAGLMGSSAKGSSTKPIYWTGSAFSAISSYEGKSSTAGTADKVANALSFTVGGTSKGSYDGSEAHTIDVNAADLNISGALTYIGRTTTVPTTASVTLTTGSTVTAVVGNVVIYTGDNTEYLYDNTNTWVQLGGATSYSLAPHIHGNIDSGGYLTNSDGDAQNNYIVRSDGTGYIVAGPQFGSSTSTYLRNDGSWATPTKSQVGLSNVANYDQSKAIKGITRSGTTFTYTCLDGTTGTFTQQDNNTTYSAATTSAAGLMSASDKTKLDGVATGAQVNQNAFSNITVGTTTVAADSATDTLTLAAGSNITLTPDATNDKITIAATNTTYSAATTSAAGLMSASDKSKLDGIASGANNYTYTLPVAGTAIGGVKSGTDITVDSSGNVSVNDDSHNHVISNIDGLQDALDGKSSTSHTHSSYVNQNAFSNITVGTTTVAADSATDTVTFVAGDNVTITPDATNDKITIAATDTTYSAATTSAAGLMSAADKTKLDGIASSANNYSLPTASSSTLGGVKVGTNLSISSGVLSATDTTYTAGTGLSLSGTKFNHSNSITAGSVGAAASPSHGGTFAIPKITYDAQGHITAATTVNITLPADNNTNYYPTKWAWTAGTSAGPTASITGSGMSAVSVAAIPSASASASGIVTTGAQTLAGAKTFSGNTTLSGTTTFGNSLFLDDVSYGADLPETGTEGQLFFQAISADQYDVPTGGAIGQVLTKTSSSNYACSWQDIVALPDGGTAGQFLVKDSATDGDASWQTVVALPTGGTAGQILVKSSSTDGDAAWGDTATNATNIYSSASTSKAYILGTTTASSANHATVYNASVYTSGSVLYGACWNDYAEYRKSDVDEGGRCVIEVGDDTLKLSSERMQPGAELVSDTFGFAIGETEESKCPIAVTGRVLAYPYEDREEFRKNIGRPVCSGPNGTVSIMSDEEYAAQGYCAIGFISAVPDYEIWGAGEVKVNNRVWIRVR